MHSSYDFQISPSTLSPGTDVSDFKGERLTVQFARGPRHKENFSGPPDRNAPPRPRRTIYRMQITGLPTDTSWQVSILPLFLYYPYYDISVHTHTRFLWQS